MTDLLLRGAGRGTDFLPSNISGLKLWLKADALSLANNDPVATWSDSSGQGNNATQSSAAAKPTYKTSQINGLPAVSFDAGDVLLTALSSATKPFSAFVVARFTDFSARTILGAESGTGMQWRVNSTHQDLLKASFGVIGSSTAILSVDTFYRLAVTYSGAGAYAFYLNGSADGSGTNDLSFAAGTLDVGAKGGPSEQLLGSIAEIIFYDSVLSAADRGNVDAYLSGKYGF